MKVSIIGCNGFLSTAIAKYGNEKNWDLDVFGLEEPNHQYSSFYKVNLMNDEIDCSLLLKSDMVVYAAGAGIQSNLREDNSLIYRLNVVVPVLICNKLKKLGFAGTFVTFGSYFEVGEVVEERKFTEMDILTTPSYAPNDYVISKRMLSRFVSSYHHNFTHWHFYLPTIYGELENPVRLIPYTIKSIKEGKPLQFTSGEQVRQYVYVDEIPQMLELAIARSLPTGIYNVEGAEILSVKEIVTLIHQTLKEPLDNNCFGTANRDDVGMKFLALDGSKLCSAIGFVPSTKISDIVDKYE